jgi:acetyl esterase/lipase
MPRLLPSAAFAALAIAVASPASALAAPPRGELLDATRVVKLSRAQVAARVQAYGLPAGRVRAGVVAYRVGYATIDVAGGSTTATGLVVLPRGEERRLRTVSYAHGTMARRSDAPSRSLDSLAGASVLFFAGAGYATVAPDYLGLGDGPGAHPFMHLASETSASLDLLPAARELARRDGRELDPRVFVTGFSQGAVAALGLARQLQDRQELAALAPMSGPYAIQHAQLPATIDGKLNASTDNYYLSYGMLAWQPLFGIFDAPGDVWRGQWGPRLQRLFDGTHDDVEILKVVPKRLEQLFTPAFLARLAHPDGGLLAALRQNDAACAWAPAVPTRLYGARGDDQVAFANSRRCLADLRAHGAQADLRDLGRTDHFGSTVAATPRVLEFFERSGGGSR